jgi:hypothetical protein
LAVALETNTVVTRSSLGMNDIGTDGNLALAGFRRAGRIQSSGSI